MTTDTANVPAMVVTQQMRHGAPNPAAYPGAPAAALQRAAYPDIVPVVIRASPAEAFRKVDEAAMALGWEIVARAPADGRIDWNGSARRIYDLVRGVTHPYPGAFTTLRGRKLLVWWALPLAGLEGHTAEPGTITAVDREGITVAAGEGSVQLITLQLEGQPELPACSLALAAGIAPGERLGS